MCGENVRTRAHSAVMPLPLTLNIHIQITMERHGLVRRPLCAHVVPLSLRGGNSVLEYIYVCGCVCVCVFESEWRRTSSKKKLFFYRIQCATASTIHWASSSRTQRVNDRESRVYQAQLPPGHRLSIKYTYTYTHTCIHITCTANGGRNTNTQKNAETKIIPLVKNNTLSAHTKHGLVVLLAHQYTATPTAYKNTHTHTQKHCKTYPQVFTSSCAPTSTHSISLEKHIYTQNFIY